MYENSREMKLWRCVYPVLLYLFANMMVQVGFTILVTAVEFMKLNDGGIISYFSTYNFSGDIERVVGENGLVVTLISGVITIPICMRFMKKDQDAVRYLTVKEHISKINLSKWYYIVLVGVLASMGLSKLVTILPIDNILGNYQDVSDSFASNPLIYQLLALVIIGPLTEELIFRGLVYKRIKGYTDTMVGAYISAIIFGIYHFNLVQGLYGFMLGILLCYVYEKYGTILAPVILHISANLIALIMMHMKISTIINNNIFLKIIFMILEVGALIAVILLREKRRTS